MYCKLKFGFSAIKSPLFLMVLVLLLFIQPSIAQVNYRNFLMAGQMDLSKENYVGAISKFNIAIQSNKDGFEAWFLRGIAKYSLGDYQGAANDFSKTVALHPLYTRAFLYLGICRDRLMNYQEALLDFGHALKLDPFDVEVYAARGETGIHIHDYTGAVNDFSTALQWKHNDPYLLLNRGVANHLAKHEKAALKDLQRSISLNSYNPDAFIKRGMIYYELDSLKKSINDYDKAILLKKDYPYTYFQRALTFLKMHDTVAVLRDYAKVLFLDTANALTYYNRALIEAAQKKYDKALSDLGRVIALNPDNVYAWFNRGVLHLELEQYADAKDDFSRTVTLFPDFVGGYIHRSIAKEQLGDKKGAYIDRKRAHQILAIINNGHADAQMLYRRYADSVYFRKIIRFEGDFMSGEMKRGKIQFDRIKIAPKPDFQVVLYKGVSLDGENAVPDYFDEKIVRYNADNAVGLKLAFSAKSEKAYSDTFVAETEAKNYKILQSGDTSGYYFISGILYYRKKQYISAIRCYDSTLKYNNVFVYALLNRGATQFEEDNYLWSEQQYNRSIGISKTGFQSNLRKNIPPPTHAKALADYNQLIRLYPSLPYVYYNRANLKTALRKFQRAIDDYSMAIRLKPHLAEAYYNRALVLLYIKENKLACKDLSKAGELGITGAYNVIKRYCGK